MSSIVKRKKPATKTSKRRKRCESSESEEIEGFRKFVVADDSGVLHFFVVPSGYKNLLYLAQGSFGVVCTATSPKGDEVVIKKLSCDNEVNTESALRELHNLWWFAKANSKGVVRLLDTWTHNNNERNLDLYMTLEKFAHSLNHFVGGRKKISVTKWRKVCGLLCCALFELHSCGAMHRDVKPENIVVNSTCTRIAVIDLGSVRSSDKMHSEAQPPLTPVSKVTTEGYRSPETVLDDENYDASLDVFGAGCLLAALRFNEEIFPKNADLESYLHTTASEANAFLDKKFSSLKKAERDLLKAMLQRQPHDRITADNLKDIVVESDDKVEKLTARYTEPIYIANSSWNMIGKIKNIVEEFQSNQIQDVLFQN